MSALPRTRRPASAPANCFGWTSSVSACFDFGGNLQRVLTCFCPFEFAVPAKITRKESTITVKRDETAKLECEVEGTAPIQVTWSKQQRNGVSVPLFDETLKHSTDPDTYPNQLDDSRITAMSRDFSNRTVFELHISLARQKDAAVYLCKASNEFGEDTIKIRLAIQGRNSIVDSFCGFFFFARTQLKPFSI